ncbi:hypothetical protein ARMSODRAFT_143121 [Armillaria solidipes]|uniref:Uncharacterized protein n=1 Tax=Armillaria solidipes TaxID=1076256 RepID=A0A2H3BFU3_9AGAR|nr:hypothetical protein ARMSODRAFT_143121 [Armillaria solidipes]
MYSLAFLSPSHLLQGLPCNSWYARRDRFSCEQEQDLLQMPTGRSRKCPWIVAVVAWSSTIPVDCQGLSRDRDICCLGGYGIAFRNFMMPSMDSAFFICIIARNSVISCWASLLFRVELTPNEV